LPPQSKSPVRVVASDEQRPAVLGWVSSIGPLSRQRVRMLRCVGSDKKNRVLGVSRCPREKRHPSGAPSATKSTSNISRTLKSPGNGVVHCFQPIRSCAIIFLPLSNRNHSTPSARSTAVAEYMSSFPHERQFTRRSPASGGGAYDGPSAIGAVNVPIALLHVWPPRWTSKLLHCGYGILD
jgi:hypothetical protein